MLDKYNDQKSRKNLAAAVRIYAFSVLVIYLLGTVIAYIIPDYADIAETSVRKLSTNYSMTALLTCFLIGPITAKVNRKWASVVSLLMVTVFSAGMFFTGMVNGPFAILMISSLLAGINAGAYAPLLNGLLAEYYKPEEMATQIARYNMFVNGGLIIFLQIGGRIAAGNGGADWYKAFALGIITIPALILFLILAPKDVGRVVKKSDEEKKAGFSLSAIPKVVIVIALVHMMFYWVINAFNTNYSVYIIKEYALGTSVQAGNAMTINRLVNIIICFFYPVLLKKVKNYIIPIGYLTAGLGCVCMLTMTSSIAGVYLGAACIGAGTAFAFSATFAYACSKVAPEYATTVTGVIMGAANVGVYFAVTVLSKLSSLFFGGGMLGEFKVGIGFAIICAVIMVIILKTLGNQAEKEN